MPNHIRNGDIEWVKVQLKIAANDRDLLQALRRVDQTIHHLFADEDSPIYEAYHDFSRLPFLLELKKPDPVLTQELDTLVPVLTQLDTPNPGHDIILILNRKQVTILKNDSPYQETIPAKLKRPEKILVQIIGPDLAKKLLMIRRKILNELMQDRKDGPYWQVNVAENAKALLVLNHDYPPLSNTHWLKQLFPHIPNGLETQNSQLAFGRIHLRNTGIKSVITILDDLPNHCPKDAIRMLDRTIGGLLAHKESPFYNGYRTYTKELFPAGLEHTVPEKDIILILNSKAATIQKNNHHLEIEIPSQLKNPEKGVAQIVGLQLARKVFQERERILDLLQSDSAHGIGWHINAAANKKAREVLRHYDPYHTESWSSWLTQQYPCLAAQDEMVRIRL